MESIFKTLIPVGGVFKIRVPAVPYDNADGGIIAMKLKDNTLLKLFNIDGYACFEVISDGMVRYPIVEYYGVFSLKMIEEYKNK